MRSGPLPPWLSAERLLYWNLCAIAQLGDRANLDSLYRKLGQMLRVPDDLMKHEYQSTPGQGGAQGYVVRKHMQFALTDLGHLEHLANPAHGYWSLTEQGRDFLSRLEDETETLTERGWAWETGIEMTCLEKRLERELIKAKRADHRRRYPRGHNGGPTPPSRSSTPPTRPDGWPTEVITTKPKWPGRSESDTAD